jgi:hypothetical protein
MCSPVLRNLSNLMGNVVVGVDSPSLWISAIPARLWPYRARSWVIERVTRSALVAAPVRSTAPVRATKTDVSHQPRRRRGCRAWQAKPVRILFTRESRESSRSATRYWWTLAAAESGKDVRQLSDQHDDHHDGAIEDQSENGYP